MQKKYNYKIDAYDMLFFGTGRPFTMEDESWSKGIFPPYPSTIYGFLRSTFLENNMDVLKNVIAGGNNDPTNNFSINSFGLGLTINNKEELLFPIPFCHVLNINEKIEPLQKTKNDGLTNNNNPSILEAISDGKKETLSNEYYITKQQLQSFLNGKKVEGKPIKITDHLISEPIIGIGKDLSNNQTVNGKLYRLDFNNLTSHYLTSSKNKKIDFRLHIDATIPNKHIRSLGGEGKKAILTKIDTMDGICSNKESNLSILYFATPLIIENITEITDYCKIETIANDNFIYVGGWDIANRKPKPSRNTYPAGTVFYIEFTNDKTIENFINKYPNNKIGQDTKQGFGEFYIGKQSKKN